MIQPVDFKTFKELAHSERRNNGRVHYALFDTYCILSIATGAGNFVYECIVIKSDISNVELHNVIDGGIPTVGRIINVPDHNGTVLNDIKKLLKDQRKALTFTDAKDIGKGL